MINYRSTLNGSPKFLQSHWVYSRRTGYDETNRANSAVRVSCEWFSKSEIRSGLKRGSRRDRPMNARSSRIGALDRG